MTATAQTPLFLFSRRSSQIAPLLTNHKPLSWSQPSPAHLAGRRRSAEPADPEVGQGPDGRPEPGSYPKGPDTA